MARQLKPLIGVLLVTLLCSLFIIPVAFAYPNHTYHDKMMDMMLFGKDFNKAKFTDKERERIVALEAASFLCIDQFGSSGSDRLGDVRIIGLHWPVVPMGVDAINPRDFQLSASNHRSCTHCGWERGYDPRYFNDKESYERDWQTRWERRRGILRGAVDKVFGASMLPSWVPFRDTTDDEKRESLCALIYYVHILGDYVGDATCDKFSNVDIGGYKIPFARSSNSEMDLFSELEKHLGIVFSGHKSDPEYKSLMRELDDLAEGSRDLAMANGGRYSESDFEEAKRNARALEALLTGGGSDSDNEFQYDQSYVYKLLKKESFYTDAFKSA